jgi:hypothetical protein
VVRQQRQLDKLDQEENEKRKVFNGIWHRFFGTCVALKAIYNAYNKKKTEKINKARMLHCANKIKRNFHIIIAQFGPDLESRNQNLNKYAIDSVMTFLKEPVEKRANKVMSSFLTNSANKYSVFTAFMKFSASAELLIRFYRTRLKIKSIYKFILDKRWDRCFVNITQNNLLGKSKPKKVAKIMKKIYSISDDTKAKVLKLYAEHCTLKYKIWLIMHQENQLQEIDR